MQTKLCNPYGLVKRTRQNPVCLCVKMRPSFLSAVYVGEMLSDGEKIYMQNWFSWKVFYQLVNIVPTFKKKWTKIEMPAAIKRARAVSSLCMVIRSCCSGFMKPETALQKKPNWVVNKTKLIHKMKHNLLTITCEIIIESWVTWQSWSIKCIMVLKSPTYKLQNFFFPENHIHGP